MKAIFFLAKFPLDGGKALHDEIGDSGNIIASSKPYHAHRVLNHHILQKESFYHKVGNAKHTLVLSRTYFYLHSQQFQNCVHI
jgi:hypothetical protein